MFHLDSRECRDFDDDLILAFIINNQINAYVIFRISFIHTLFNLSLVRVQYSTVRAVVLVLPPFPIFKETHCF